MFRNELLERVKLHIFCMNFMIGFMETTLRDESQQKFFCRHVITNLPSSRMLMIIAGVVIYVKFMHKGVL